MNNVSIVGRLTRDPQIREISGGNKVCNFTIAIDKGLSREKQEEFKAQGKPTADFINIVAWNRTAEFAANYLAKGLMVGVTGRLESSSYEDEDGKRIYRTDVNCFNITMIEWKDSNNKSNAADDFGAVEGFHPVDNDDIPF